MSRGKQRPEAEAGNVQGDSDDDFHYEEVFMDEDWSLVEGEEDLETTVKAIQDRTVTPGNDASCSPEVPLAVDEILCKFLSQIGMTETLDCFQAEWMEVVLRGQVDAGQVGVAPDIYTQNLRLYNELKNSQREREEYRRAASAAVETLARVTRARDVHRMKHMRAVQDKNRLVEQIKKLKARCDGYEPEVKRRTEKYHTVLKQAMQKTLERNKVLEQVNQSLLISEPHSPQ